MIREGNSSPIMSNDSSTGSDGISAPGVTAEGENCASLPERLRYVDAKAPEPGSSVQIAQGVHWTRIPLPIDLNHINVWMLRTDDGYVVVDTGMAWDIAKDAWQLLASTAFNELPLRAIFVTHIHPDHIGLAAWLQQEYQVPVWMSRRTFEQAEQILGGTYLANADEADEFFRLHGLQDVTSVRPLFSPGRFARLASGLPHVARFIEHAGELPLLSEWTAIETNGHAEGHLCLSNAQSQLLISGDQVLPTISSNIGFTWRNTDVNPLRSFLESLERLRALSPDTVVLPSHGHPFRGLQLRIEDLVEHHQQQLQLLLRACAEPQTAAQIVPMMFRRRPLFGMHLFLALAEALAHLEYLVADGRIERIEDSVIRYRTR